MVVVYTPLSIWVQCASLAFTLGGMHGDLLAIRFFLFLAYVFLFLNACLGSPLWGAPTNSGGVAVDSLLWAVLNMYVHGSSLVRLVLDERPVHLTEEEDALWRMFYRTGGLSKRLFHAILVPHLEVIEAQAGDELLTEDFFYIQYHGRAHLQVLDGERLVADRYTRSGEMFDFKCLGMFPANTMIAKHVVKCRCENRTKLFRFSRANMERIAHHNFVKGIWQSLLINNISFVLERQRVDDRDCILPEGACDAIFAPLQPWEEPNSILAGSNKSLSRPTAHLLFSIHKSFSPPWPFGGHPTGMRQVQLPPPVPPPSGDPQAYPPLHNISSRGWHDEDEDDIGTTGHRMRTWLWSIPRRVMSRRNSAESSSSTPALGELEPDTVEDDFEGKVATELLVEATKDWQVVIHDRPEAAARASRENEKDCQCLKVFAQTVMDNIAVRNCVDGSVESVSYELAGRDRVRSAIPRVRILYTE